VDLSGAENLLPEGVAARTVETSRLATRLLESGPEDGVPVLFLHGNVSSSLFYGETLAALPEGYRGLAPDLRSFGGSETKPLDATRGLRDFSEDIRALVDALGLGRVHMVGWSAGGTVAMQYAMDHPEGLASLTLIDPMSPFGFGGTKDVVGTPCWPDYAGSGGGTANPEFVRRLDEGDRGDDDPNSPRNVLNAFYYKPPFRTPPELEEVYLTSMLSTKVGEGNYPGDATASENWPTVAPGGSGMNNAISPKHCDLGAFAGIEGGPDVLWIRGADDAIVSDTSLLDFGFLGQLDAVPGWPGEDVYPPQPMVAQIRTVLDGYAANGGAYREEAIEDCGHSPHIEKPEEFRSLLFAFLEERSGYGA
jgi:pimeloyl-ACP methyl ester carboxylesterase